LANERGRAKTARSWLGFEPEQARSRKAREERNRRISVLVGTRGEESAGGVERVISIWLAGVGAEVMDGGR
jgi:hypothetical protein